MYLLVIRRNNSKHFKFIKKELHTIERFKALSRLSKKEGFTFKFLRVY